MKNYNLIFLFVLLYVLIISGADARGDVSFFNLYAQGNSSAGYSSDLYPHPMPSDNFCGESNLCTSGDNNLFVQSGISTDVNGWWGNVGHVDASSSLSVEPAGVLSAASSTLASYSFYEHVFNKQGDYGLIAQTSSRFEFMFSMDAPSTVYWGILWNTSSPSPSTDGIGLPDSSWINFNSAPSGTSFGSVNLNNFYNVITFNFNTNGGGLGTGAGDYSSNGNMQFAFSNQPFNEFPAVVPEPISSILFVTGGMLLAGRRYLIKKEKNITMT